MQVGGMFRWFARFFKEVLRRTVVLIAVGVLSTLFFLTVGPILLRGLAERSAAAARPVVEEGAVLVIDLTFNLVETADTFDPAQWVDAAVAGSRVPQRTLLDVLRAIETAAEDDRIAGIYLRGNLLSEGYGSGPGAVEELRAGLLRFRAAGKPIHGHFTYAGVLDYYLFSVCDRLYVSPLGGLDFNGIGGPQVFFGKALRHWGIAVQAFQAGDFKSAIEPFVRDGMSEENRRQTIRLLDRMWGSLTDPVAVSRRMDPDRLRTMLGAEPLMTSEWVVAEGLADVLAGEGDVIVELMHAFGESENYPTFPQVSLDDYLKGVEVVSDWDQPYVAVITLEGEMVSGEGFVGTIGGDYFGREMRYLQREENLQAVVLRINSPGGSAEAAEALHREIRELAKSVPVVVSMGSYAASGGYWIATEAETVFANPTTITGSIGVFGLHLSVADLANRFDLSFDGVQTGPYADAGSFLRPLTETEVAAIEREIAGIYRQFLDRVEAGRGLARDELDPVAEGRVWTGRDAVDIGLVDQIGGLREALVAALGLAGMDPLQPFQANIVTLPERYTSEDFFRDILNPMPGDPPVVGLRAGAGSRAFGNSARSRWLPAIRDPLPEYADFQRLLSTLNDPNRIYTRLPWVLRGTVRRF